MIIHRNIQQHTAEWEEIRRGKMTASHAQAIAAAGKGLDTYIREIICDMIAPEPRFRNSDMERGSEQEPAARLLYEFETGEMVEEVGFITYNDYVGYSPDGLVGKDGLIELKRRIPKIHLGLLLGEEVDSATIWQMQAGMLVSGRQWCDFGSYNPGFKQALFRKRFYPDTAKFMSLKMGFMQGEQKLKQLKEQLKAEL